MGILNRGSSPSPDGLVEDECSKVEKWRLHVLEEAGYSFGLAQRLAMSATVDLHVATRMIREGCDPEIAAEILL